MTVKEKIGSFFKALGATLLRWSIAVYRRLEYVASVVGELTTGGFLVQQTELAHGSPLGGDDSLFDEIKELAVKERDLLITESMFVHGTNGPYCNVKGIESLILGRNTMRFYLADRMVCKIRNTRDEPGFVVYREDKDERIGRIEKMGDDYAFFPEPKSDDTSDTSNNETSAFTTDPAYICSGDFINRRFLMKNAMGENVAKVKKAMIAFPAFDHYVVRVAPGMDPIMVRACLCVIDEDLEDQIKAAALYIPKKVVGATLKTGKAAVHGLGAGLNAINPFK